MFFFNVEFFMSLKDFSTSDRDDFPRIIEIALLFLFSAFCSAHQIFLFSIPSKGKLSILQYPAFHFYFYVLIILGFKRVSIKIYLWQVLYVSFKHNLHNSRWDKLDFPHFWLSQFYWINGFFLLHIILLYLQCISNL